MRSKPVRRMGGVLTYWVPDGKDRFRSLRLSFSPLKNGRLSVARREKLISLLREASLQGAVLRQTDLCLILLASRATLKRDLRQIRMHSED